MIINRERLAAFFTEICEIESPSKHEGTVSQFIQDKFNRFSPESIYIDNSSPATGSETGNLVLSFNGDNTRSTLFFCCHMDTVEPADGIRVRRSGDVFTSTGDTILGADDKSGIAVLYEMMSILKENDTKHCPIELVFTTCEEIGLLGAKAFDVTRLQASYGYALDSSKRKKIIIGAPAANRLKVTIQGKAAHSGSAPETGVNALAVAAEAVTQVKLGRIDTLSTANFGLISGGTATNIIPETVVLEGEVRSHSAKLLKDYTRQIQETFDHVADSWTVPEGGTRPRVSMEVYEDFPLMILENSEPVLQAIRIAGEKLGRTLEFDIAGGGSDANIFCGKGLKTAILPTGMHKVHTTEEEIDLNEMTETTELLLALVA